MTNILTHEPAGPSAMGQRRNQQRFCGRGCAVRAGLFTEHDGDGRGAEPAAAGKVRDAGFREKAEPRARGTGDVCRQRVPAMPADV